MKDALSELKEACRIEPARSERETIARGRSTWFRGQAARAPDGTIALALSEEARVIINEDDVRSVKKEGEGYSVEVSAEAGFLLRLEKTLKATPTCNCRDGEQAPAMQKDAGSGSEQKPKIEITDIMLCDLICGDFVIAGIRIPVCVRVNCRKL